MLITEFRIVLPISVDEYQVGQLYTVAEASKDETGGGEGVEVLINEPYEKDGQKGQYTHKIYHLNSKVPSLIQKLAPKDSLKVHEEAWNAYPYCRTVLTNPYLGNKFSMTIETWHKADMGEEENVHGLDQTTWDSVVIANIDIGETPQGLKTEFNPATFTSEKTKRGPLTPGWKEKLAQDAECPHMCAYKLVTLEAKAPMIQKTVENMIMKAERNLFDKFHKQLFCTIDDWVNLTMEDIRQKEENTKKELDEMRKNDEVRGMTADG
uniref:phosphatidylinositol transfer protein alpha isoform-like n=1 Tax=Solea senegalensis TaxID=28829 RepID=UPI001CD903B6|nr:phosphatidylinositol transfer protein alpha isoform-like [Solea senegalensis]